MAKLSPMDRAFFMLETEQRPMNIGLVFVLAPTGRQDGKFADRLVARMLQCPVGPPFRSRVVADGIGRLPALEEVRNVDPADHVYRHQLRNDADRQVLFEQICAIHVRRLDRSKPMWELHVFEGLPHGRVALYFKTHHGLIDGLGFLRVIRDAVSTRAGMRTPQAIWRGLPVADEPATGNGKAEFSPLQLAKSAWRVGRAANDMARLLWRQGLRDAGLGQGLPIPFVSTPNVLKVEPSANRVLAHCALPLARVKAIAQASTSKVNDVLLATLDVAMSHYLEERGAKVSRPLVADMPVALRTGGEAGNRITILQVPMGRPGGTAAERLADIVRETRQVKHEVQSLAPDTLFLYSIIEHAVASAIETLNFSELPMLANAVISNPTGLDTKVFFNGAAVELAIPVSVVAHHQVLNITISNYADELQVTFIAQREAVPDLQHLADLTVEALQELTDSFAPPRKKPVRRGTSARSASDSGEKSRAAH